MGWISLYALVAALMGAAWMAIRRASQSWWHVLPIVALAAVLLVPLYQTVTGDISRVLPPFLWDDGPNGKDQIILASIAATFLLPLILAAWLWRGLRVLVTRTLG